MAGDLQTDEAASDDKGLAQGGNCPQNRIRIADLSDGVDPFQSGPGNGQGDGRRPGGDEEPIIENPFPFFQDQLLRGGLKGNSFPAEPQIDSVHFRPGGIPESNCLSGNLSPDPIGEHHGRTGDFPFIRDQKNRGCKIFAANRLGGKNPGGSPSNDDVSQSFLPSPHEPEPNRDIQRSQIPPNPPFSKGGLGGFTKFFTILRTISFLRDQNPGQPGESSFIPDRQVEVSHLFRQSGVKKILHFFAALDGQRRIGYSRKSQGQGRQDGQDIWRFYQAATGRSDIGRCHSSCRLWQTRIKPWVPRREIERTPGNLPESPLPSFAFLPTANIPPRGVRPPPVGENWESSAA